MKSAIIGLPQSGKTALAGAVTGTVPDIAGLPQVRHAVVKVPDDRLAVLERMYEPKKVTEATIEYIDVPGFSLADQKGLDDLKRYLPEIRQAELLVVVVRAFESDAVAPYRNRIDPVADLAEFREELVYADLETITNRAEKVEKALKKPTKTHEQEKREFELLTACKEALEKSQPLSTVMTTDDSRRALASFGLLTPKPLLVVFNVSEDRASEPDPPAEALAAATINLCAATELDISQLDAEDRPSFLADIGVTEPARDRLIRKCYEALGQISFLTVGPDEVRAWTVSAGDDAVEAASKIHSDIARGFIRAETVAYADLIEAGDMKAAKAAGKVRQEGKSYVIQDGDIINFKFNV